MTRLRTLSYPAGAVPDHLRCRKNDGKQWRCPMRSLPGITICDHHYAQQRQKLARYKAQALALAHTPDPPPKSRRRRKKTKKPSPPSPPSPEPESAPEGEEEVVLALEVPGRREDEAEMRELVNGVMTISPAPARVWGNGVDRKVGAEGVVWGRCVRSKNVEPVPVGPAKV